MKIFMACPAPAGSRSGNCVTAKRWARFFKELGHRVVIRQNYQMDECDVLLALHARKSFPAVARYRRHVPDGPLIVALTGTDLYRDFRRSPQARQAVAAADRLVVLQPQAVEELPAWARPKARIIWQSAVPLRAASSPRKAFEVCVLGHLRPVKDPFRTAQALRLLADDLPIRVTHAGGAISEAAGRRARRLMAADRRYRWLGEVSHTDARRIVARSHLLVVSSHMEGGANAASEAIVAGVPIVSSRIGGIRGLLGDDYPGFFPVGDTRALAGLLARAATDGAFYQDLKTRCIKRAPLLTPARERSAWQTLLAEVAKDIGGFAT